MLARIPIAPVSPLSYVRFCALLDVGGIRSMRSLVRHILRGSKLGGSYPSRIMVRTELPACSFRPTDATVMSDPKVFGVQ